MYFEFWRKEIKLVFNFIKEEKRCLSRTDIYTQIFKSDKIFRNLILILKKIIGNPINNNQVAQNFL